MGCSTAVLRLFAMAAVGAWKDRRNDEGRELADQGDPAARRDTRDRNAPARECPLAFRQDTRGIGSSVRKTDNR
jgi:hypothetical protein